MGLQRPQNERDSAVFENLYLQAFFCTFTQCCGNPALYGSKPRQTAVAREKHIYSVHARCLCVSCVVFCNVFLHVLTCAFWYFVIASDFMLLEGGLVHAKPASDRIPPP